MSDQPEANDFPCVFSWPRTGGESSDVALWISENRAAVADAVRSIGAVLFRGFPLRTPEDFDAFISKFEYPNFRYADSLSNAVRVSFTERVFSANEAPADVSIYLHHEMAQTPVFPSMLFFFCEQPAESGGATPLSRSDTLLRKLTDRCPEFMADCEKYGLKYTSVMPGENDAASGMGRSWQSTWNAQTRDEAESRMNELGYTWQWLDDNCLRVTTPRLQAVKDLGGGRTAFFNQLIAAFHGWKDSRNDPSKSITFGDGTPLDTDVMARVIEMAEEITFNVPWQAGDVALVDNYVTMHGRRTFDGTRSVLASLVAS